MFRNRTLWLIVFAGIAILAIAAGVYFFVIQPGMASPVPQESSPVPTSQGASQPPTDTPPPPEPPATATLLTAATATPSFVPTETSEAASPPPSQNVSGVIDPANLGDLNPVFRLTGHESPVTAIAFSPDSSLIASASEDGAVRIWQVNDGTLLYALEGHQGTVRALGFSPDGTLLASGGDDRLVRVWEAETGELKREIRSSLGGRVLDLEFYSDGDLIAYSGHYCYVELRNVATGILRRTFVQPECVTKFGGSAEYLPLEFTEDGSQLITGDGQPGGSGGSIQRWEVDSYAFPELIRGYDLVVRDIHLNPDEHTLAVALVGSPDIWLLDLESRMVIRILEGHQFRVNSVDYSPDGDLLVSGSSDRTIRFWNPVNGAWLESLEDHDGTVNMVRFSPDGTALGSASADGSLIIWKVE